MAETHKQKLPQVHEVWRDEGTYYRKCVCARECVSYMVIVHEDGALTSQPLGKELPRFYCSWGQLRTTLKQEKFEA